MEEGTRFQVLAPVVRTRKGEFVDLFAKLQRQGYSRVRVDGMVHPLTDPPKLKKQEKHDIEVVVDRLTVKAEREAAAHRLGRDGAAARRRHRRARVRRPARGRPRTASGASPSGWPAPTATRSRSTTSSRASFSFNSPYGACPECTGLGIKKEVDPELVVPDAGADAWPRARSRRGRSGTTAEYFTRLLEGLADGLGFRMDTPWRRAAAEARRRRCCTAATSRCTCATATATAASARTTPTSRASCRSSSAGIDQTESEQMQERYEGYMRDVPCPVCNGTRLKPEILAVTLGTREQRRASRSPRSADAVDRRVRRVPRRR